MSDQPERLKGDFVHKATWQLAQDTVLPPSQASRRQFFFVTPGNTHDVHHTYAPVSKLGSVLRGEAAWGEAHVATFCSSIVRLDDGRYRLYYTATSSERGEMWIAVAESEDGLAWRKPPLGQHTVDGQPTNRIVFEGLGGQRALVQPQVLRLPNGRWRMYFWRHAPQNLRYLAAHSTDGLRWEVDTPPRTALVHPNVLGPESAREGWAPAGQLPGTEDPWQLKALRTNDACYVYYNGLQGRYEFYAPWLVPAVPDRRVEVDNAPHWHRYIHRRFSEDGLHWGAPELILVPDTRDPWDLQFYYLAVQWHEDWMIASLGHYRVEAGQQTQDLALAFSRDGRTWHRPLRGGFIPRQAGAVPTPRALGEPAADAMGIYAPNAWIDEDQTWLCLYSGTHLPHNRAWGDVARPRPIMGARWPKHRFVGLEAGRVAGGFTSEPFYPQGDTITLDADIRGWLRAELCDVFGHKHEGYHLMDAVPVTGDSTAHVLRWEGADARRFRHDAVRLRFEYVDGVVYSIAF
jgi:hypothetical protein